MIINDKGIKYLTFEMFDKIDFIKHCFSTKIGGFSKDFYFQNNLGFGRGEDKSVVLKNYIKLSKAVGFDYKNIVMSAQVHNNKIYDVTCNDRGKGIIKQNDIKDMDGLITNKSNLVLTTFYADCVPLFFVDKIRKVIALSHSGWKGTILKIGKVTIDKMIENYNCNIENILLGIGPCICKNCFEVDYPVYNKFANTFKFSNDYTIYDKEKNKYYIDLKQINKKIALDCGIKETNIEIAEFCTKCNNDLFYSHRQSGGKRGSLAAFLEMTGV